MSLRKSFLISAICLFCFNNNSNAIICGRFKSISAGETHTFVLADDNTLWACGAGPLGLGRGLLSILSLQQVKGENGIGFLTDIVSFDAGFTHSLTADANGNVWSWGSDFSGQLGNGFGNEEDPCYFPIKVHGVNDIGFLSNIVYVSAGRSGIHSLAVSSDGYVYAWGLNDKGQCGDGNSGDNKYWPVKVLGSKNDGNYLGDETKIVAVDAGVVHSLALDINGQVYHWGEGSRTYTYPEKVKEPNNRELSKIIQIASCAYGSQWNFIPSSIAVDSNGFVWRWIYANGPDGAHRIPCGEMDTNSGFLENIAEVSTGHTGTLYYGYCMARTKDGHVLVWNNDDEFPLYVPAGQMSTFSGLLEGIISISAGYEYQNMAVDGYGYGWGWGFANSSGQMGVGDIVEHIEPTKMLCFDDTNSIFLTKTHEIQGKDPNCAKPFDGNNYLVFTICCENPVTDQNEANYYGTLYDFNIIDHLPVEVNFYSASAGYQYDANIRTVKWLIPELQPGDSCCFTLTTKVNRYAQPGSEIINFVELIAGRYYVYTTDTVPVCNWDGPIIYVDKKATSGFNNGTSWNDACLELQDALTAAKNIGSDIKAIWVAEGNYSPANDINVADYKSKSFELPENVALIGHFHGTGTWETDPIQRDLSNPDRETILNGQIGTSQADAVKYVIKLQEITSGLIDGFTIKGGYDSGAGIYLNNAGDGVSIVNCKIKDNQDYGVKAENYSYPGIYNCIFRGNILAGIYYYQSQSETVSSCKFDGEDLTKNGISISHYSNVSIEKSVFQNHTGEGISGNDGSCLTLHGSVIRWNDSNGISLFNNTATEIINNWIHNNGGSGLSFIDQVSVPLVRNNTFYDNHVYGIRSSQNGADPNIINCIIKENEVNDLYKVSGTFNKVNYCLLQHSHSGNGNKIGDPCFINISTVLNDLHIDFNSLCRNAGDTNCINSDEKDIDGDPRIADCQADIGGDEYYWSKADYDRNRLVNFIDFAIFSDAWLDQNQIANLNSDNYIDIDDLALFCEDWLWKPAWDSGQWMAMLGNDSQDLSIMASEDSLTDNVIYERAKEQIKTDKDLILPDVKTSMKERPKRLKERTDKFYQLKPQEMEYSPFNDKKTRASASELLKILEGDWNSGDLQDVMSEETYLSLRQYTEQIAANGHW